MLKVLLFVLKNVFNCKSESTLKYTQMSGMQLVPKVIAKPMPYSYSPSLAPIVFSGRTDKLITPTCVDLVAVTFQKSFELAPLDLLSTHAVT